MSSQIASLLCLSKVHMARTACTLQQLTHLPLCKQHLGLLLGLQHVWGAHQHARLATSAGTNAQQQKITLKTALRQLYKRVHPDLFTDYPAEQVGQKCLPLMKPFGCH